MMNSGAPITGIDRRPWNKAGRDIQAILLFIIRANQHSRQAQFVDKMPDIISIRQSRLWQAEHRHRGVTGTMRA
jgi:hypothetical protein